MKHLRWGIPLVLVFLIPWSAVIAAPMVGSVVEDSEHALVAFSLSLTMLLLMFAAPVVMFVLTLVGVGKVRSTSRSALRKRSRAIVAQGGPPSEPHDFEKGRIRAAQLFRQLLEHQEPAPLRSYTVPMSPGERIVMQMHAHYARFYGQDVTYSQGGAFAVGSPLFVLSALGASAARNRSVRKQAEAMAVTQWREPQFVPLLVTDRRIVLNRSGEWLSFYYGGIHAVHPHLERSTLVLEFGDTSPLRLEGPDVPSIAVWTIRQVLGLELMASHPHLEAARSAGMVEGPRR